MAVMGALADQSIFRLKRTWDHMERHYSQHFRRYKELVKITESGARELQAIMETAMRLNDKPNVPFIGLILNSLVFLSEQPKFLPAAPAGGMAQLLIDFARLRRRRELIDQVERSQQLPYMIELDEAMLRVITEPSLFQNQDDAYDRSLVVEPRQQTQRRRRGSFTTRSINIL